MTKNDAEKKAPRKAKGDGGYTYNEKTGVFEFSLELTRDPVTGNRRRIKIRSKDYEVALEKFQEKRALVLKGMDPFADKSTVEGWMWHWLETIAKSELKPTTYDNYEGTIRNHILPEIGHHRIIDLVPEHIRAMIRNLINKMPTKNPRTAQLAHAVLSASLTAAMKEGKVDRNVASLVPKPKTRKGDARDAFTVPEAQQIIRYCIDTEYPHFARVAAAFMLGARQAECLGIQDHRIDYDKGLIDMSAQLQSLTKKHGCSKVGEDDDGHALWLCGKKKGYLCPKAFWDFPPGFTHTETVGSMVLTEPKSAAGTRLIPIVPPLLAALKLHKQRWYVPNEHGLMFTDMRPGYEGRPQTKVLDQRAWKKLLEDAGVRHLSMHSARHTTVTLLQAAGVDFNVIMQIVGHNSMMTTRGYAHLDQTVARAALEAAFNDVFAIGA